MTLFKALTMKGKKYRNGTVVKVKSKNKEP